MFHRKGRDTMKKKKRKIAASIETAILVEEGGFEPPKRYATDLQSAPFGHSGTPPYSVVRPTVLRWGPGEPFKWGPRKAAKRLFGERKKEPADMELSPSAKAEWSRFLLTMELVDGLEPPTC